MTFALSGWMLYTMYGIFGLMFVDLLLKVFRSSNSFNVTMILDFMRDVLYYVLPLMVVVNMMPLDPTGWVMMIAYYVGGVAVIWNYIATIKNRF